MKKRFSISSLFLITGCGAALTLIVLCLTLYGVTRNFRSILVCLLTASVFTIWAVILVHILQSRLTLFADDVCGVIDEMMADRETPVGIFDNDTLLDRIRHQLYRLYQTLSVSRQNLKEQQEDLYALISDISHQVKTPTTNLKLAAASLMEQEMTRNQQLEYLQSMDSQLDKLDFLISVLVKSSRLEAGVIELKEQPSDIFETLAVALGGIYMKAEEMQLSVTVDCPAGLIISHDSKWTAEALFNILDNAVKYTPEHGAIRIAVQSWESYAKIEISDTGKGIPESRHGSIFKRFYREPEVHNMEGIGIGLYLSRKIISSQGGYIQVVSSPGKGAAFSIFLPADSAAFKKKL